MTDRAWDFEAVRLDGARVSFAQYAGKVLLVVNTASLCGFTPQYRALQALHERYAARGLEVLAFPCNQFGRQEPGDAAGIAAFCSGRYGVTFTVFDRIDVNGAHAHPLYRWLVGQAPGLLGSKRIKWNFTKFLVRRDGTVFRRYAPRTPPEAIVADIEALLAEG